VSLIAPKWRTLHTYAIAHTCIVTLLSLGIAEECKHVRSRSQDLPRTIQQNRHRSAPLDKPNPKSILYAI